MTDREKIIDWVDELYPNGIWSPAQLDALQRFATIAQNDAFEQAATRVEDNYLEHYSLIAESIRALKEK